ncbi:hypothetical protein OC834_001531 [Tilletia horrida]|nr:hypothetical protein OC834_001531 [Tilletia horrida]
MVLLPRDGHEQEQRQQQQQEVDASSTSPSFKMGNQEENAPQAGIGSSMGGMSALDTLIRSTEDHLQPQGVGQEEGGTREPSPAAATRQILSNSSSSSDTTTTTNSSTTAPPLRRPPSLSAPSSSSSSSSSPAAAEAPPSASAPSHIRIPSRLWNTTTAHPVVDINTEDPGAGADLDADDAEAEFLTPLGATVDREHNPFSLPQSPDLLTTPTAGPAAATASTATPLGMVASPSSPEDDIPALSPPYLDASASISISTSSSQTPSPTGPSAYAPARASKANIASLSSSCSSTTAARQNSVTSSSSGSSNSRTSGTSYSAGGPSRTDSTRTTVSSANLDISSEAGAETDVEAGSVLSGSAGGSSSLGRSGSCASTTPTSPGLHDHREVAGPGAAIAAAGSNSVAPGTGPASTDSASATKVFPSVASAPSSDLGLSLSAGDPAARSNYIASHPAAAPPSQPHQQSLSPRSQALRLADGHGTRKARRGSLPSITTSASAAVLQLRLTANSSVTLDDEVHAHPHASTAKSDSSNSSGWPISTLSPRRVSPASISPLARSPLSTSPYTANSTAAAGPPSSSVPSSAASSAAPSPQTSVQSRLTDDDYVMLPSPVPSHSPAEAYDPTAARKSSRVPIVTIRRPKTSPNALALPFGSGSADSGLLTSPSSRKAPSRSPSPATPSSPSSHMRSLTSYRLPLKTGDEPPTAISTLSRATGSSSSISSNSRPLSFTMRSSSSSSASSSTASPAPKRPALPLSLRRMTSSSTAMAGADAGRDVSMPSSRSAPEVRKVEGAELQAQQAQASKAEPPLPIPRLSLELDLGAGLGLGLGFSLSSPTLLADAEAGQRMERERSRSRQQAQQALAQAKTLGVDVDAAEGGVKRATSSASSNVSASTSASTLASSGSGASGSGSVSRVPRHGSSRRSSRYDRERLEQKPLPPGPPLDGEAKAEAEKEPHSVASSSVSLVPVAPGPDDAARALDAPHRARDVSGGSGSGGVAESDFMERMLETPVALLSPPIEDMEDAALACAGAGGTVRMRRTPSSAAAANRHRRIKSSDHREDYFGALALGTGSPATTATGERSSSVSGPSGYLQPQPQIGSERIAKSLSNSPQNSFSQQGVFTSSSSAGAAAADSAAAILSRSALRRLEMRELGRGGTGGASPAHPSSASASSARGLGIWQGAMLGDPDDDASASRSTAASANSSRQHLPLGGPGRTYSTTLDGPQAPPPPSASSGRMSSLGRRLSSVFDGPPRFKSRASLSGAGAGVSGTRSYASSAAGGPSEPGSPSARIVNLPTPAGSGTGMGTGGLLPALEPGTTMQQPSRSRPSSSIGFFRNTLRFDRKPSVSGSGSGAASASGVSLGSRAADRGGPKNVLKGEAKLLMTAAAAAAKSKVGKGSSSSTTIGSNAGSSPSKIPVSASHAATATVSSPSLGSRSPTKKLRKPRPGTSGATFDAPVPNAESQQQVVEKRPPSPARGRAAGRSSGSMHSRSPSVDALRSARSNADSPPLPHAHTQTLTRAQSRSSLALAELESSIEAAAAKMTSGIGADVWAKEVRALFVVREIIQTERSYAKHLEALIGAVRKTAAQSASPAATAAAAALAGRKGSGMGGGAGLMTYTAVPSSSSKSNGAPAPHILTMKTLLPPMIVLSRSLAARMEQNPTSAGVGAAFTLLQEQIEANFVSWSRVIGTIMDALRVSEGPKGKGKDRIGLVAPSPPMLNGPFASISLGPAGVRGPPRSSSLDALALTRPSTPVLRSVESEEDDEDDRRASTDDPSSFPIWATDPDSVAAVEPKTPPMQPRKRSSSVSLLDAALMARKKAAEPSSALAAAALSPRDAPRTPQQQQEGRPAPKRSSSALGFSSHIHQRSLADAASPGQSQASRRLGLTNDDLRALDPAKWEVPVVGEEGKLTSPASAKDKSGGAGSSNGKAGSKKKKKDSVSASSAGGGGGKLLEPQDIVIMPTQRVVRYVLLLKDLLANTPAGGTAHVRVERALQVVETVAEMCNKVTRGPTMTTTTAATWTPATSPQSASRFGPSSTSLLSPGKQRAASALGMATVSPLTPPSPASNNPNNKNKTPTKKMQASAPPTPAENGSSNQAGRPVRRGSFVTTVQAVPRTLKKVAR